MTDQPPRLQKPSEVIRERGLKTAFANIDPGARRLDKIYVLEATLDVLLEYIDSLVERGVIPRPSFPPLPPKAPSEPPEGA